MCTKNKLSIHSSWFAFNVKQYLLIFIVSLGYKNIIVIIIIVGSVLHATLDEGSEIQNRYNVQYLFLTLYVL